MHPKIKVEFLIPTTYNPDKTGKRCPIEISKRRKVKNETIKKFGAISMPTHLVHGVWINKDEEKGTKERFFDMCQPYNICIDCDETFEEKLSKWKKHLETEFLQQEIFMIWYPVTQA
ncbi:hypothetical protein HY484_00305 [Candidatus Woesearchaeota archaeon]|nr:hypothetical protein [Candidatus Woesearchaeota archaeon]